MLRWQCENNTFVNVFLFSASANYILILRSASILRCYFEFLRSLKLVNKKCPNVHSANDVIKCLIQYFERKNSVKISNQLKKSSSEIHLLNVNN